MRFICERHAGKKVPTVLREELGADVIMVPDNPDPGDNAVVTVANNEDRIIVTRDNGFPDRPICTISNGVVFIPQAVQHQTVALDDVLECLRRFVLSGKLDDLGHAVCTLTPSGVTIKYSDEEISFPLGDL